MGLDDKFDGPSVTLVSMLIEVCETSKSESKKMEERIANLQSQLSLLQLEVEEKELENIELHQNLVVMEERIEATGRMSGIDSPQPSEGQIKAINYKEKCVEYETQLKQANEELDTLRAHQREQKTNEFNSISPSDVVAYQTQLQELQRLYSQQMSESRSNQSLLETMSSELKSQMEVALRKEVQLKTLLEQKKAIDDKYNSLQST